MTQSPLIKDMLKISSYDEVDEVLRTSAFGHAHQFLTKGHLILGGTLLTLDGEAHLQRRRMLAPVVRPSSLSRLESEVLHPTVLAVLATLVGADRREQDSIPVDLVNLARQVLAPYSAAMVGIDGVTPDRPDVVERFVKSAMEMGELTTIIYDHGADRDDPVVARATAAQAAFHHDFFAPSRDRRRRLVEQHGRGEIGSEELPRDLLTLLIRQESQDSSPALLEREVILFVNGSVATLVQAVPLVVGHLLDWIDLHPDDGARMTDSDFVRDAVHEGLRLAPVTPGTFRRALRDVRLRSGRELRAGDLVYLDRETANRDPVHFGEDAEIFNPHRQTKGRSLGFGFAFGGGQHMCIGRGMAVGTEGATGKNSDDQVGALVSLIQTLFEVGLTRDPDRSPELDGRSTRVIYTTFPVLLSRTRTGHG